MTSAAQLPRPNRQARVRGVFVVRPDLDAGVLTVRGLGFWPPAHANVKLDLRGAHDITVEAEQVLAGWVATGTKLQCEYDDRRLQLAIDRIGDAADRQAVL